MDYSAAVYKTGANDLRNLVFANRKYFESANDTSLLDVLVGELSGTLEKVCVRLFRGPRVSKESGVFNPADLGKSMALCWPTVSVYYYHHESCTHTVRYLCSPITLHVEITGLFYCVLCSERAIRCRHWSIWY